jgi:Fur family transcriptional regulator, ferric uptake regulator
VDGNRELIDSDETGARCSVTIDATVPNVELDIGPNWSYNIYSCDTVATISAMLKRHNLLQEVEALGVRLTAQRRALIETIQHATNHLDAADLLKEARKRDPNIDRATVYRTIELLKRLGLIDELDLMHLNGEKHYYEVKTKNDHLHLACFRCGAIVEFTTPTFERLKQEIAAKNVFNIQVMRLEVGGLCKNCSKQEPKKLLQ